MRTNSTQATSAVGSADVKAVGGPSRILNLQVANTGSAGTGGTVEIRDAQSPAGDTGTLRWSVPFLSTAGQQFEVRFADGGLHMPNGIRVTFNTVTNASVWVRWEG